MAEKTLAAKISNVSFKYRNEEDYVIKNLSLSIYEGEFIAVVGRNGSGKSTLSKLINGLIELTEGSIEVFGLSVSDPKNLFDIRKSCGIVFQNPDNQMVAAIVEDDIVFGPENLGLSREEIGKRIEFALNSTGTNEFKKSTASKLSGGQKQRVAIAGVLAIMPKILILDESTSMLDPKGRKEVMDVVKRLNREEKMTVLEITHYMEETVDCDRIIVLDGGQIVKDGTPSEVFADEETLIASGLAVPLPLKICHKLQKCGIDVGEKLTESELEVALCELLQKT